MSEQYLTPEDLAIAASNGIHEKLAKYRFYTNGMLKETAITKPVKKTRGVWDAVKDRCEPLGITRKLYHARRQAGMTVDEACSKPPTKQGGLVREKKRKFTQADIDRAVANGIKEGTFKNRVYGLHWSVERAATEPKVIGNPHKRKRKSAVATH